MGILGEQREKGAVKIFEKMAENCENYSMKLLIYTFNLSEFK